MTNPKTGWVNREWLVESISTIHASSGAVIVSSARHPYISEAVFLGGYVVGGGTQAALAPGSATVIAHDRAWPDQGTVSATVAATLGPQQFLVAGLSLGTQLNAQYLVRGR